MAGPRGGDHGAGDRCDDPAGGRQDAHALAHRAGGEDLVPDLGQRDRGAGDRGGDDGVTVPGGAVRGGGGGGRRRGGGRGAGHRGLGSVLLLAGAEEQGEQEGDGDRDAGADQLQGEVADGHVGGQADQGREDEGVVGAATGRGDRPADGPTGDAEVEGELEREVHTVDRRLGDAGEHPGQGGGAGDLTTLGAAGADEDGEGGGGLGEDGGDQRAAEQGVALGGEVVHHQRDEAPVQAEEDEHLPEAAHDGAAQPRGEVEDGVHAGGDPVGGVGGQRADGEQDERDHHQQDDQRGGEVADRVRQQPGEEALEVALQPHGDDDRDDRAGVARHHHRDAEEGHRVGRGGQRDDARVDQRAGERHRGHVVGPEPLRSGEGQEDRQEVEQRVGRGVQDGVRGGRRVQPVQVGGEGQEGLEQAGTGERPQDRLDDGADQLDEPVEDVAPGRVDRGGIITADPGEAGELLVDLRHVVADHDLVLAAGLHHGDDAGELLDRAGVGLRGVLQRQAQPGGAMGAGGDVRFAAHLVDDPVGQIGVVHGPHRESSLTLGGKQKKT
ncbi:hypothetical protein SDC9_112986 [bioreactor metagenome]|uniref:Uncharacterized protein n=1 Tax=bioreactor metagenome TaxID=1076179 RepID=A0A645BKS7_9ZZZZ